MPSSDSDIASAPAGRMDDIYRYQRHIYDLTRRYFLLGRDDLLRSLDVPPGGTVLEIGCGTGRNLVEAASLYPQARLFGLDISSMMLETAEAKIVRSGLTSRIRLGQGDAARFDAEHIFGRCLFDRVMFSYGLSMMPRWKAALSQGYAVTAPGGRLLVVDFGRHEELPRWFRGLLRNWLARFDVAPRDGLRQAVEGLAASTDSVSFRQLYRDYACHAALTKD